MNKRECLSYRDIWLFPLVAIAPMGLDICIPGMTTIANSLNSSIGSVQWLISGFILCMSLGQLFFGPMVDRYGSHRIFLLGCGVYLSCSLAVFLANDIMILIIVRLLQGLGASAVAVSIFASVPILFTGSTIGRVYSLFNGVISLVPVIAPIIGGALILGYGWKACFYFLAGFIAICLTLVVFKPLPSVKNKDSIHIKAIVASYIQVMKCPQFRLGAVASSFGFASQLIFFSSSPIVIIEQFGIPVNEFGFYFAINAAAITSGSLFVSYALGRAKESSILLMGAGCLCIAAIGFILSSWLLRDNVIIWSYIIPATIGSFGFALLMGAGASVALSSFKTLSGTASALIAAIQMSFSSLVAWICIQFWSADWLTMSLCYFLLSIGVSMSVLSFYRQPHYLAEYKE